ncbi:DUF721 domain-containing protein [Desulfogranum mediterraneum]|uniref:DUF721 domain-containing protein n=1 Tax=Desulfogranum mediterraneum TaxID=160661 RepID=UPI0004097839|nr:DciA family protein [Desulfogranum mediterraneum]
MQSLADDLKHIYEDNSWQRQWALFTLVKRWQAIAGEPLWQVTYPAFFRGEVLWIFVANSAWMQHLQYGKVELLAKIAELLPEVVVNDIRLQLYPPDLPDLSPPPQEPPVLQEVEPGKEEAFKQLIAGVADEECRRSLHKLWRLFAQHRTVTKGPDGSEV